MNHGIHRIHGILTLAMIGMAWTMNAVADYVDVNNEKYVPLSYIQASGNQWIVTDIRPTCTDTVKMKFRLSTTGTQALYCSRTHFNTNTFTAFYLESVVRCDRYTNTVTKGNTTLSLTADTLFVADYETRKFFVDGVEQNVLMEAGTFTPGSALMLFASHTQGEDLSADIESSDVANKASYRLYYFELYASGSETPKHRLVPVQRKSDAAVGLYDTVGEKFYGHANNSAAFAANQSITSISARQRYPWNGLVDINFTITGEDGLRYATSFTAKDMVGGTNITMATVHKADGSAANLAKEQLLPGTYNWVWDATADLPKDWQCNRVTVTGTADIDAFSYSVKFNANGGSGTMANESFTYGTAKALTANAFKRTGYTFQGWATSASGAKVYSDKQSVNNLATSSGEIVNLYAVWKAALYMVVNLSSGAISYLDSAPSGGWTDNPYKQTRMAFRRIENGTFTQTISSNSKRTVTITKPYYISLHPLTLYHGYTLGCSAPGDHIANSLSTYGTWEKKTATVMFYDWHDSNHATLLNVLTGTNYSPYDPSLVQGINKKTNLTFSIPTEAQLTLARSSMNLGSTYVFSRDWFFNNLGNGSVTNPCQGQTYNGETTWFMSCVSQTGRAYVKNQGGSQNTSAIGGATGKTSVCVRLCLVVN